MLRLTRIENFIKQLRLGRGVQVNLNGDAILTDLLLYVEVLSAFYYELIVHCDML